MKKPSQTSPRRGDGQWLAWAASGLLTFILSGWYFGVARMIYESFLADDLWRYDYAEFLVYPIFALCLMTGFFGSALLMRMLPQIGFIAFLRSTFR